MAIKVGPRPFLLHTPRAVITVSHPRLVESEVSVHLYHPVRKAPLFSVYQNNCAKIHNTDRDTELISKARFPSSHAYHDETALDGSASKERPRRPWGAREMGRRSRAFEVGCVEPDTKSARRFAENPVASGMRSVGRSPRRRDWRARTDR